MADGSSHMTVIGVTGGSGAGKSTLIECWKTLGAAVINADMVYHELLASNDALNKEITSRFGAADRKKLAAVVFADEKALADLNAITHKYILEEIKGQINSIKADVIIIEAIYLHETELWEMCDKTIAVIASHSSRAERAGKRDKISENDILLRIKSQKPDEFYIENSDIVIENNESLDKFMEKAEAMFYKLKG